MLGLSVVGTTTVGGVVLVATVLDVACDFEVVVLVDG